jgi:hypothetical protein
MRAFAISLGVLLHVAVACQPETSTVTAPRSAPTVVTPVAMVQTTPALTQPPRVDTSIAAATAGTRAVVPPPPAAAPVGVSTMPATPATAGAPASAPVLSADCNPADKKPDPTRIPFTQLQGYQRQTKEPTTGPSKPIIETDPGLPEWTIYRPEVFDEGPHPVLAWAQGGCLKNGTLYGQWLLELASWGYIVLSDGPPTLPGDDPALHGTHQGAGGAPQIMAIDWVIAENERACSPYYHKVTVDKLAVSGQSCGGLMSLAAAGDKRIITAIIGNSGGLFSAASLHSPLLYLIGGMNDLAYQQAENDYTNINNVPLFNANMDTGHGGTWQFRNGGEYGRVGLGWLNWQLKGDDNAKKMFVGPDCELCKPPSMWVVKKKMLD